MFIWFLEHIILGVLFRHYAGLSKKKGNDIKYTLKIQKYIFHDFDCNKMIGIGILNSTS